MMHGLPGCWEIIIFFTTDIPVSITAKNGWIDFVGRTIRM